MTQLTLPDGAIKMVAGANSKLKVTNVTISVGGTPVKTAEGEIDLPLGALVLVLPQGEPKAAVTPEPPSA